MATASSHTQPPAIPDAEPAPLPIPPLEPGDHLSRAEFERRYHAMPHLKKAELIDGVVYMPSPARYRQHSRPHGRIVTWLGVYETGTPGVFMGDNGTVRLDDDNEPQPDAFLLIERSRGGQASISDDDYIEGAPELVVEVAASSVSYDLHAKLRAYQRAGVREYLIWRTRDRAFDWLILRDQTYQPLVPDERGVLCSPTFPGLWLDAPALLAGQYARVDEVLREGLACPEHAAFVAGLAAPRPAPPPQDAAP